MEFSNTYNGVVFFVDILGIGALTQNKIKLKDEDFSEWEKHFPFEEKNNQFLAAVILTQFREILVEINKKFKRKKKDINVTQLSDCAFIWSESIENVVIFANNFMCEAIRKGVFCRGGLSYGQIIETEQEHKGLGRFIVGEAVTNAVRAESLAKGCRINCDLSFGEYFASCPSFFYNRYYTRLVNPSYNYSDFSVYDEFRWYYFPDMKFIDNTVYIKHLSLKDRIRLTKERLKLSTRLLYDTRFAWNVKNKEGKIHLYGSLLFLTENEKDIAPENRILKVSHTFSKNFIQLIDEDLFDRKNEDDIQLMLDKIEKSKYFVDINE